MPEISGGENHARPFAVETAIVTQSNENVSSRCVLFVSSQYQANLDIQAVKERNSPRIMDASDHDGEATKVFFVD